MRYSPKSAFAVIRNLIGLLICALAFAGQASAQEIVTLGEKSFVQLNEISLRDSTWYFLPQSKSLNQPGFAGTEGWVTFNYTTFGNTNAPKGWRGEGWFSVWLQVDKTLIGKKLSLRINHDGASELFMDGHPIGGYGQVGHDAASTDNARAPRQIIPIWLNDTKPHLFTIHYANHKPYYADFTGFEVWIGDYKKVSARISTNILLYNTLPLCAAAQIILALLHFLLYLFYRKRTIYLYYAAFVFFVGLTAVCGYLFYQSSTPQLQWAAQLAGNLCTVMQLWTGVTLLYVLGLGEPPRKRLILLSVVCAGYLAEYIIKAFYFPEAMWNDYFYLVYAFWMFDAFRSVIALIRSRDKGAWLIVTGVIVVVLTYFLAWADVFGLWPYYSSALRLFIMNAGELVLPVCLSLYLALDFTRTNQILSKKLSEVETLSAMALKQEAEKNALIAGEARRLEILVADRTAKLELQAEKLKETDLIKSRFFTNITHEFKTPLTLILNPAEELMASPALQTRSYAHLIYNNATRLLGLLNQLLDLSKIENGAMKVTYDPLDLVEVIGTHLTAYKGTAAKKNISLSFTSSFDKLWIMGDHDKIGKVVGNLLSNAVRFTDNGSVDIALEKFTDNEAENILIKVTDTGKGIPKEKLAHIFTRFYQADPSDTRSAEGSGIGLALAKELTELMGGSISVVSEVGKGTEMSVVMRYFPAPPIQHIVKPGKTKMRNLYNNRANAAQSANPDKPLVLLVEDHEELRNYLHSLLSRYYLVISAEDGEQGIEVGMEQIPTAIITDIMLPRVDGYELASRFKTDIKTSHIPIIMLTAKADTDSKVQGIATGVDAYLGKPFNNRELLATVENLINTRNRLREYYTKERLWLYDQTAMPDPERDFISLIRQTVLKQLDDETYTVERLANDIGMSVIQLHRKLKAVAGQGPGELIRLIKLETAYQLLEKQNLTVAEVAYRVGFSNPTSFSVSFSRHFGFPPKSVGVV